jgi:hypothetical protein
VVALQQPYFEVPAEAPAVAAARLELDRLQTGLPRALLAAPADVVRALAERALHADAVVGRRRALMGERPALDDLAEAAVTEAAAAYEQACAASSEARSRAHLLLAQGNVVALGCLGVAGSLHLSGLHPMATPVVAFVVGAAGAPLAAVAVSMRRRARATAVVTGARGAWGAALEAAGVPTMGALAARRLAVSAWEQRQREVEVAEQAAARQRRAWQRLAGPGVPPGEVEVLLERLVALRRAQLRLLAALLEDRAHAVASGPLALAAEPEPEAELLSQPPPRPEAELEAEPPPALPPAEVAPPASWLDEAMERLRGRKLHFWFRL